MPSDEVLLSDISWTQIEVDAYLKISEGFLSLSNLPETDPINARRYIFEHKRYAEFALEAQKFLDKLLAIKNNRNL